MRSSMFFEDTKADTEAGFKRFIAKGAWKTCRIVGRDLAG